MRKRDKDASSERGEKIVFKVEASIRKAKSLVKADKVCILTSNGLSQHNGPHLAATYILARQTFGPDCEITIENTGTMWRHNRRHLIDLGLIDKSESDPAKLWEVGKHLERQFTDRNRASVPDAIISDWSERVTREDFYQTRERFLAKMYSSEGKSIKQDLAVTIAEYVSTHSLSRVQKLLENRKDETILLSNLHTAIENFVLNSSYRVTAEKMLEFEGDVAHSDLKTEIIKIFSVIQDLIIDDTDFIDLLADLNASLNFQIEECTGMRYMMLEGYRYMLYAGSITPAVVSARKFHVAELNNEQNEINYSSFLEPRSVSHSKKKLEGDDALEETADQLVEYKENKKKVVATVESPGRGKATNDSVVAAAFLIQNCQPFLSKGLAVTATILMFNNGFECEMQPAPTPTPAPTVRCKIFYKSTDMTPDFSRKSPDPKVQ